MASTLNRRGNERFHVVSTWNPRGMFVGLLLRIEVMIIYISIEEDIVTETSLDNIWQLSPSTVIFTEFESNHF